MKIINTFWNTYSQSWWLPSVTTLGLVYIPTLVLLVIYGSSVPGNLEGLLSNPQFIYTSLGVYWLLIITSLLAMVMTGIYQIRSSLKGKGVVNIVVAIVLVIKLWLPIFAYVSGLQRILSL